MPIRFRCHHCSRLLGIARRKAGSQIRCPQCDKPVLVPTDDEGGTRPPADLNDLDDLVNPVVANGQHPAPVVPDPEPSRPAVRSESQRPAATATKPPAPKPAARPQPRRRGTEDDPLFEQDDVDAMLGLPKFGTKFDLDEEEPKDRAKPVSGMDAMSLDDGPGKIVLSSQKATLLVVAVALLLGVAFALGYVVASHS